MLPGTLCDARAFGPQLRSLSHRMVVIGDLTHDASINRMASRVLRDAPPKFALLGHSMGGIVAFEVLRQSPERVERLALLDTNPMHETEERRAGRLELMRDVLNGRLETVVKEKLLPHYFAEANADNDDLRNLILTMALDLGDKVFDRQSKALLERVDSQQLLDKIDIPTLLLCGSEDKMCTPATHEMMASRIANATLVILEGAGHFAALERPVEANQALHRWLDA